MTVNIGGHGASAPHLNASYAAGANSAAPTDYTSAPILIGGASSASSSDATNQNTNLVGLMSSMTNAMGSMLQIITGARHLAQPPASEQLLNTLKDLNAPSGRMTNATQQQQG